MSFKRNIIKDIIYLCETKELKDLDTFGVFYKDVLLWTHPYDIDPAFIEGYEIKLVDEEYGIKIIGRVPVANIDDEYDFTHYGYWENSSQAMGWLKNPVDISKKDPDTDVLRQLIEVFDEFF